MNIGRMIGQFQKSGKLVAVVDVDSYLTPSALEGCEKESVVVARGLGTKAGLLEFLVKNFDVVISVKGK